MIEQRQQPAPVFKELAITDFKIKKKLGQGAYGKVYLAKYKDGQYAIKKLSKDFLLRTNKVNSVFRERDILMSNKTCPFLPKIYHAFTDDEYLYLVMEYIPGGMLQEKIALFSPGGFQKEVV